MFRRSAEPDREDAALTKTSEAEPNGFFSAGSGKRSAMIPAAEAMAQAHATMRGPSPVKTARSRIEIAPTKTKRAKASSRIVGPTPERLAKGDIAEPRSFDAPYRAVSAVERLRDKGGFEAPKRTDDRLERLRDQNKLDHDAKVNQAMFMAAEKLRRHYEGCAIGVKAQDLNRVTGGDSGDLVGEEAWVEHYRRFTEARKIMGYTEAHPNRGAACIVVAVVCEDMTVSDAATKFLLPARAEAMKAAAMDRLRVGLFALAMHWREI